MRPGLPAPIWQPGDGSGAGAAEPGISPAGLGEVGIIAVAPPDAGAAWPAGELTLAPAAAGEPPVAFGCGGAGMRVGGVTLMDELTFVEGVLGAPLPDAPAPIEAPFCGTCVGAPALHAELVYAASGSRKQTATRIAGTEVMSSPPSLTPCPIYRLRSRLATAGV